MVVRMCETASSCQVDSKQRIHAVRFSETTERIELGDVQSAYKTSSPIRAPSFTRRGILSKTRLTTASSSTEDHHNDYAVRSSSAPSTSIALVHKDSIELILKRGISMTSKSSGINFLSTCSVDNKKETSPTKWKMRFWMPKSQDNHDTSNKPGQSSNGNGFLELLSESSSENLSLEPTEENDTSIEMKSCPEENNEDDNFISEELESSVNFQQSQGYSQRDFCFLHQPLVNQEKEEINEDEEFRDSESPKK